MLQGERSTPKTNPARSKSRLHVTESYTIALAEPDLDLAQDEEWCEVRLDDRWRTIRFHDYSDVFDVPGLYESIFHDILQCRSPGKIAGLLAECARERGVGLDSVRVLDLGAGNGLVGEALAKSGVGTIVGVDILEAAEKAVRRDRPGIYADYVVGDMTAPTPEINARLGSYRFNAMTCVAALGFGDIPARAFIECFNLVEPGGLIAFNIKEEFLDERSESGFAVLIRTMIERGVMDVYRRQSYIHRLSTSGAPLPYVAFVAIKRKDAAADD